MPKVSWLRSRCGTLRARRSTHANCSIWFSVALAFAAPACGQFLGGGIKVGVPFADALKIPISGFDVRQPAYTVGPFIEFRLPARLAIETGALYEGLRFDYNFGRNAAVEISTTTASTWQFPLLLKYRTRGGMVRPFISGGVAAYRVGSIKTIGTLITSLPTEVRTALDRAGNSFVNGGGVVAGGVEFKVGPLRIAPEVRFTRWAFDKSLGTASAVTAAFNQSRVHFLVGFGF